MEQRLPEKPLVVKPVEKVGKYGGDWRVGHIGANLSTSTATSPTRGWSAGAPAGRAIEPNLAERWTVNDAGTEFTFYLRKGVKWSDGVPWTADDIMFWYEGILLNKQLTPSIPTWLRQGNTPVKVEKIDDYTVKFTFPQPNGLFLFQLANVGGTQTVGTYWAKHYYSKFHPQYAGQEAVDKLAKEAGAATGSSSWAPRAARAATTGATARSLCCTPWKLTLAPGEKGATDQAIAERNPYYFKVDTAGNQLPYLDRCTIALVSDEQVLVLKILNGEIDMMDQFIATAANKPVFYDNQAKGGYHFFETTPTLTNTAFIQLNLNHSDPVKKKIFNNKDFRIGLSYAINRKEIIEQAVGGLGQPPRRAPRPDSPFCHERLAKQYTEYDVEKANEYLDKVLPKKDAQGMRLRRMASA